MFAISIYSIGIAREPAFLHTLALLEKLYYRPQARKAKDSHECWQQRVGYKKRACDAAHTYQKEKPPTLYSPIILCLDDKRMADADTKEHGRAYEYASKVDIYCGIN